MARKWWTLGFASFSAALAALVYGQASIAAIAAIASLTLIRGSDFAPAPACTATHADSSQLTVATPVTS
jgi:hypothetical protein